MKVLRVVLLVVVPVWVLALVFSPSPKVEAQTGPNMYLQLQGIEGESTNQAFNKSIVIDSFSWGVRAGNTPRFNNLTVEKSVDKASPKLFDYAVRGKAIPAGRLSLVRQGESPQEFLTYCFTGLRVKSVKPSAGPNTGGAQENVSFSYRTIVERYQVQNQDGSLGSPLFGGWDLNKSAPYGPAGC